MKSRRGCFHTGNLTRTVLFCSTTLANGRFKCDIPTFIAAAALSFSVRLNLDGGQHHLQAWSKQATV
jgi:hypothetical protein